VPLILPCWGIIGRYYGQVPADAVVRSTDTEDAIPVLEAEDAANNDTGVQTKRPIQRRVFSVPGSTHVFFVFSCSCARILVSCRIHDGNISLLMSTRPYLVSNFNNCSPTNAIVSSATLALHIDRSWRIPISTLPGTEVHRSWTWIYGCTLKHARPPGTSWVVEVVHSTLFGWPSHWISLQLGIRRAHMPPIHPPCGRPMIPPPRRYALDGGMITAGQSQTHAPGCPARPGRIQGPETSLTITMGHAPLVAPSASNVQTPWVQPLRLIPPNRHDVTTRTSRVQPTGPAPWHVRREDDGGYSALLCSILGARAIRWRPHESR
jgi:hypothetical protein